MARVKVSDRAFLNADSTEADKMESATGGRYTLTQIGKSFDYQFGANPDADRMFAIFGFHTRAGNTVSGVTNDPTEPGTIEDAAVELADWLDGVYGGTWAERAAGEKRGPKYDNAVLALVLTDSLGADAQGDVTHYQKRLESDKGYRAKVVGRDDIKQAYWGEMAKRGTNKPATDLSALK